MEKKTKKLTKKVNILGVIVIENESLNFKQILVLALLVFAFVIVIAVIVKFFLVPVLGGRIFWKGINAVVKMIRQRGP